jgi:alkylation response protein AidB-like acyl-CoA dehydrogenase
MPIAISGDHQALASTIRDFLAKHRALSQGRQMLEAGPESLPPFWAEAGALGWLGLHLPEAAGGSGFGLLEAVVVAEELGRALTPGPFAATMIASAVINAAGASELTDRYLPGLAEGSLVGAVALEAGLSAADGRLTGSARTVLGGGLAGVLLLPVGDDVAVVEAGAPGVSVTVPRNIDPAHRSASVTLSSVTAQIIPNGRGLLLDLARLLLSAEAAGVARECTERAAAHAKVRVQFGRPIGVFQAVKHHCANMAVASELAAAAVWDAARSTGKGGDQLRYATAIAAALAIPGAVRNAELHIQVLGGIGYTWEHDAHLFFRRALAIEALVPAAPAEAEVTALTRRGVRRERAVELPPEAETVRAEVRAFVAQIAALAPADQVNAMQEAGYLMPHWPKPYGRAADAIGQLVIEQELDAAGITRPNYSITGYVILTLISQASPEQVERWVGPALRQELIWCQLFSEPDAGSDAAGIKTRGTRTEGGWLVNGQKVWSTMAHEAAFGLATVRTNPDVPKHKGITMMVIDMRAPGVTVRPLRQLTGRSEFNEVFLDNVFVPDGDVVGPVDGGWRVARATLGNESISVGANPGSTVLPDEDLIAALDAHPERLPGGTARVGRYLARLQGNRLMNLRAAQRAVAGSAPGPEGAITKLVYSEAQQEAAEIGALLAGPDLAYLEGPGGFEADSILTSRVWSIGGGTSEIKRNQIGELILGLPRDPLLS